MLDDDLTIRRKDFIAPSSRLIRHADALRGSCKPKRQSVPGGGEPAAREIGVSVTLAVGEPLAPSGVPLHGPDDRRHIGGRRGENVAGAPRRPLGRTAALGLLAAAVSLSLALAKPALVLDLFPRLAAAYAAVGLKVNLRGFEFEHVTARLEEAGGVRSLAVEGVLRNIGKETRDPLRLRVTLSDAMARPVYHWTASTGVKALAPGETAPFRARLAAPPGEAQTVRVDFAP